ncbi:MAG: 30S ribosomal protein S6 [Phycisphaerales bacterium]
MSENTHMYEGMFLFPQSAAGNLQEAAQHVKDLLARAGAEIVSFAKFDERRLAYEIKGNKRGVYFLTYFKAQTDRLVGLDRDCNLSEQLLRHMVLQSDLIPADIIAAADGAEKLEEEIKNRGDKGERTGRREGSRVERIEDKEAAAAKEAAEAEANADGDANADADKPAEKPEAEAAAAAPAGDAG